MNEDSRISIKLIVNFIVKNSRGTRWSERGKEWFVTFFGSLGLPTPPGKPILIPGADESQPDVVAIRWERSPSNGGSAIVGYLVEHRRLGSQHWVRSTPGLCTFPELTLSGLEPGWRYQFRIRAQNAVGFSRPSEISDPLTVTLQRSASSAPYFDLEVKDTTVLENEQVILWCYGLSIEARENSLFLRLVDFIVEKI